MRIELGPEYEGVDEVLISWLQQPGEGMPVHTDGDGHFWIGEPPDADQPQGIGPRLP